MKGIIKFKVTTRDLVFDFELKRNITILQGNSAKGKTTLLDILDESLIYGGNPFIKVEADAPYYVYFRGDWKKSFMDLKNTVIFIEEESNGFILSHDFARFVKESGNYFVIVNREPVYSLPYSINEIYTIENKQDKITLAQVYNFKKLYHNFTYFSSDFDTVIIEDSKSGYSFFKELFKDCNVISAGNNTKFVQTLAKIKSTNILCIADGAAFGCYIRDVFDYVTKHLNKRVAFWLPESFEWILLKAGIITFNGLDSILANPSEYIDCIDFVSWERFFTYLAVKYSNGRYKYGKDLLDPYYTSERNLKKATALLPKGLNNSKEVPNDLQSINFF